MHLLVHTHKRRVCCYTWTCTAPADSSSASLSHMTAQQRPGLLAHPKITIPFPFCLSLNPPSQATTVALLTFAASLSCTASNCSKTLQTFVAIPRIRQRRLQTHAGKMELSTKSKSLALCLPFFSLLIEHSELRARLENEREGANLHPSLLAQLSPLYADASSQP